jgi:hypothetical protein
MVRTRKHAMSHFGWSWRPRRPSNRSGLAPPRMPTRRGVRAQDPRQRYRLRQLTEARSFGDWTEIPLATV